MSTAIPEPPVTIDLTSYLAIGDVQDLSQICRLCGIVPPEPVLPLFGEECRKNFIFEKISNYLRIQIDEQDPLPKSVCSSCIQLIVKWDMFIHRSREVQLLIKQRCRLRDTATNEQNSINLNDTIYEDFDTYTYNAGTSVGTWSPFSDQQESYGDGCNEKNIEKTAKSNGDSIASDDEPLASLANRKTTRDLYQDFYTALKKFRDHFVNTHHGQCNYSDFSDTSDSDSDSEDIEDMDVNDFDDLTESNMRKDRMDEETRVELSEVQTKVNGKVYFTCKICGKNLSSSHTYVFHKRIHTGERPCVCHVCGKQFRVPNGLQRHLTETHLKQRRYICLVCHKNFANSQNLKQHMRIHTGERPYVCSHCGKRFTQSGSLHVHLKTHTEIFPHICADCGAKFRLRSSLKRHRLKHTGERPHVCVHCGKGFRQRHELSSHQLTHSDSAPHACAACGAAFRQRRALRHHCRRLHAAPAPAPSPAPAPLYE